MRILSSTLLALCWTSPIAMLIALMPANSSDDMAFCSAAKQFASAAELDVGVWIDRMTRNGGMGVHCDRKIVEFKRFTYAPSSSMSGEWKDSEAAEWNASKCGSFLWGEAILQGWRVELSVTAADGGQVVFSAKC